MCLNRFDWVIKKKKSQLQTFLNKLVEQMNVNTVWVPGHGDILVNCKAYELARNGFKMSKTSVNS